MPRRRGALERMQRDAEEAQGAEAVAMPKGFQAWKGGEEAQLGQGTEEAGATYIYFLYLTYMIKSFNSFISHIYKKEDMFYLELLCKTHLKVNLGLWESQEKRAQQQMEREAIQKGRVVWLRGSAAEGREGRQVL